MFPVRGRLEQLAFQNRGGYAPVLLSLVCESLPFRFSLCFSLVRLLFFLLLTSSSFFLSNPNKANSPWSRDSCPDQGLGWMLHDLPLCSSPSDQRLTVVPLPLINWHNTDEAFWHLSSNPGVLFYPDHWCCPTPSRACLSTPPTGSLVHCVWGEQSRFGGMASGLQSFPSVEMSEGRRLRKESPASSSLFNSCPILTGTQVLVFCL